MAFGIWFLKDGRGYSRRVGFMFDLMKEIQKELNLLEGTEAFSEYLNNYILTENHKPDNDGNYKHIETGEVKKIDIDFREFTMENQNLFWEAAQNKLNKMVRKNSIKDRVKIKELKLLLNMNNRAIKGENPMSLNHLETIVPPSGEKKGPGWED